MRTLWALCVLLALTQCRGAEEEENEVRGEGKVVETRQGPVKGYLSKEGNYFEFFGIPYATAPTGNDKFKAPLEPPTWTDVFEATNNMVVCHQPSIGYLTLQLEHETPQEDCLKINVFVPNTNKKNLSVIVYVHGGAFVIGISKMVSHEPLLRHDVIVVNFNYRLGVFGFLCLGTKDVPGNAGMKDQVAALRWVQRTIANFGGNPDDVTIGGYSSGSASVEHLMLSPMAKGLFTKVIAESGSALSPWAITPDPIAMAKRFMKDVSGLNYYDITAIEEYFKELSTLELVDKAYMSEKDTSFGFVPCVEPIIEGEESFYNESPLDIIESGNYNKVPIMTGFASEEGLFRVPQFSATGRDKWGEKMQKKFSRFLPQDLKFSDKNEKKSVAAKVKKFYFGDKPVDEETIKEYIDYFTDVMFGYPIIKSAMLHARNGVPVYLYDFSYVIDSIKSSKIKTKGASHCAQTAVVHKFGFLKETNYTQDDVLMQDRLAKMWSDFAKFGTPVTSTSELLPVAWDPVDPEKINYLHMDMQFETRDHLLDERYNFWDEIYQQYYRKPVAPPHTPIIHTEL